ncbi:MAG TPA: hypothetical protein VEH52_09085 [Gaiellaceae bacterium]|jgi:hypothetical protein|nr:hypothetical protein [Gaiellaceae bacterium]
MRRFLLVGLAVLALAVPVSAFALRAAPNDGTLSVSAGRGTFVINGKGGVIGGFTRGRVIITDPIPDDGTGPIVSGEDWTKVRNATTTTYGGTKVRFRDIGGTFRIRVIAVGVNLSVVGRDQVTLKGAGTVNDGMYSVNGDPDLPVPALIEFTLNASTP